MRMAIFAAIVAAAAGSAYAEVKTQAVEYKQGDKTFVGYLAYDDAVASEKTLRPGVLICHEWWGNNEYAQTRARQLAEEGYVAFALDMYGKGEDGKARSTKNPQDASKWAGELYGDPKTLRERAMAGYQALTSQKMVDKKSIAAIGYCMGGTVALELARAGAELDAVVAFHTSVIAGKDAADNGKLKEHGTTVLVCHGQDDTFVKPEQITDFHAQMKEAGVDYEFVSYAGAVHSFTSKEADSHKMEGVKYQEKADKRSWARMLALFVEKWGTAKG